MKLFQASPTQSRASFILRNVRPFCRLSLSSQTTISLSVCSFCRISRPSKVAINSFSFVATTNACMRKFNCIHRKAARSLSPGRKHGGLSSRMVSTCPAQLITAASSLVARAPSSLVLAAGFTHSDAPQRSDEWFALRKDRLTTSTFSTALGLWKGDRRFQLWNEKVFSLETHTVASKKCAMEWGVLNEAAAIDSYKSITGREVSHLGFAIHSGEQFNWLGASPDGLLGCFAGGGILEVKCPYNKGKPEKSRPWSAMPFYYMPQVQGQLEIMNREWADLYCWTPNGSTIFRVHRDRDYWELIHGVLREFWWENVMPAREALLLGREQEAESYKPTSTHRQTGLVIFKSLKLASQSKLLCRETAGHVEFYNC